MIKLNIKKSHIVIITILFQGIFFSLFNLIIYISKSVEAFKSNTLVLNIAIIVLTFLMVLSIRYIIRYDEQELELHYIKANLKNTEELINLLRIQKHDHINHLQTLQSMAFLSEYDKLSEYLNGIVNNYKYTGKIIRVGHPALTALINVKKELAEKNNINFNVVLKFKINGLEIQSWDLCSLVGNLIDNAIEAAMDCKTDKFIKIIIDRIDSKYLFEITNSGYLSPNLDKKIFQPGFTTKGASEGRGYGLYIVQKILDKYNGKLGIENINDTVNFKIYLPIKENTINGKVNI